MKTKFIAAFAVLAFVAIGATLLISSISENSTAGGNAGDWDNPDHSQTFHYSGAQGNGFRVETPAYNNTGNAELDFGIDHTAGSLPPGLSYTTTHVIIGTFSTAGTYNYTVFGGRAGLTYVFSYNFTVSAQQHYSIYYSTANSDNVYNMPNTQTVTQGSPINLSSKTPTRYDGYEFKGWKWGTTTTIVQPGASVTPSGNITLTAQWALSTSTIYTLYYHANGGYATPSYTTAYGTINSATAIITNDRPLRDGYTFLGWSLNEYATTATHSPGQSITLASTATTLYAVWEEAVQPKTIIFNANGGEGSIPSQTIVPGNTITLPVSGVSKTGCILVAWNLGSNSGHIYSPGQTYTVTDNATFYAQYSPLQGNVDPDAPTSCTVDSVYTYTPTFSSSSIWRMWVEGRYSSYTPVIDTKPSWMSITNLTSRTEPPTFEGTPTAPGVYIVKTHIDHTSASVVAYSTITWTITVENPSTSAIHTLTFDANGGSGSIAAMEGQHNNALLLPSDGMNRAGYKHGGWWINERGTDVVYPLGSNLTIVKDTVARACWVAETHIVIFDANGGTMENGSGFAAYLSVTNGVVSLQSTGLIKAGHIFAGWYKSTNSTEIYAPGYLYTTTSTVTFVAYWIPTTSTTKVAVKIDPNGGTGGYTQQIEKTKKLVLPVRGILKSGSVLEGFTAESVTGTSHALGEAVLVTAATTYYAAWSDGSGGGGSGGGGSGGSGGGGGTAPTTITVTFDANGGSGSYPTQTIAPGGKATKPADPTRSAHIFSGWKIAGGASDFSFTTPLSTDTVLQAQWTEYYSIATNGLQVTVTQRAHLGFPTEVIWWDGTTDTSSTGTFRHTFPEAGAGTITVTTSVSQEETITSQSYVTIAGSGGTPSTGPYTITWIVGEVTTTTTVAKDQMPGYAGTPTKAGHRFTGWSPAIVPASSNATYVAGFAPSGDTHDDKKINWMQLAMLAIALIIGTLVLYRVFPLAAIPYALLLTFVLIKQVI